MPSPIAHLSVAYILFRSGAAISHRLKTTDWPVLIYFAFISILPDFDSFVGLLARDFGRYHNNLSHSLIVGLFIAAVAGLASRLARAKRPALWTLGTLACYETHILLDFLTWGRGVMAFWPFTPQRFASPLILFFGLHWSHGFFSSLHIITVISEGLLAALAIILLHRTLKKREAK